MLNRREILRLVAGTTAAFLAGNGFSTRLPGALTPALPVPEQEEGPFYIGAEHIRRDITEGRPGVPLDLRIALVDCQSFRPLAGAAVDIWHCDAGGVYSGFSAMRGGPPPGGGVDGLGELDGTADLQRLDELSGGGGNPPPDFHGGPGGPGHHLRPVGAGRFLRGVQVTDARGVARFTTIYPGWYAGREIHIHLKVHHGGAVVGDGYAGGKVCHTGQLFFPDATNAAITLRQPYAASQTPRTTKADDQIYQSENGDSSLVTILSADSGYAAKITLAVDPNASPPLIGIH